MPFDRVALLRAVNVSGHGQIAMADLRAFFEELGLGEARTLLQSGNVVFNGGRRTDAALERLLESEANERLGLRTAFLVRSRAAMREVVGENPFMREAKDDPGHLLVYFLKETPPHKDVAAFMNAWKGVERCSVMENHAYVYYPEGAGRSKFKLPWTGTGRNWNTVTKVLALLD